MKRYWRTVWQAVCPHHLPIGAFMEGDNSTDMEFCEEHFIACWHGTCLWCGKWIRHYG